MDVYFKYKRFEEILSRIEIQDFLDSLIKEGWQIIFYNEIELSLDSYNSTLKLKITILAGKKQIML